jgi:hypothetical protein
MLAGKDWKDFQSCFYTFHIIHRFFRLFTLFAAPAIKLKLKKNHNILQQAWPGSLPKTEDSYIIVNKILLPKKRFDLKSNRQYFDLKSHFYHARKNDLKRSKIIKKII